MYLSWIIPAYNEEKRIEKTIREVSAYLGSKNFAGGYEIVIINSASLDGTANLIERLVLDIPNLKLLSVENKGKGHAVKEGMLMSSGEVRLFSDADNSTAPSYFDLMELMLHEGYQVVISSRDSKDAVGASRDIKEPMLREFLGNLGNLVIQIFGVWGIWDTQNGFKACTAKASYEIFSRSRMGGFSFDIEMLALARKLGFRIGIIPVKWKFDPDSRVKLLDYIKVLVDVFIIRLNFILGRYTL